jgi:hypothetical protein
MYRSRQKESQRMPIRLDASVLLTAGPPIDSDQGMLIYVPIYTIYSPGPKTEFASLSRSTAFTNSGL